MNSEVMSQQLVSLAIKGLPKMFDANRQLFWYRAKLSDNRLFGEVTSLRYTLIALLGLNNYERGYNRSPIDVQGAVAEIVSRVGEIQNIGDLGLLLWLCALASPDQGIKLYFDLEARRALEYYPDALQSRTMELSWFLTGLTYTALNLSQGRSGLNELVVKTYAMLLKNYGGKGIFSHMNKNTVPGMIRWRIGSFADQVYPIYALTKFANVYGHKEALEIASKCAEVICSWQGPLGQWWWHYDSVTGRVVGRYPVYAVHQDGMAPMALLAIGKAAGIDFKSAVNKGIEWINGNNELGRNLLDTSCNVIWRCISIDKYKRHYEEISSLLKIPKLRIKANEFQIQFECRPYHLGWILYAFN